jgi:hypothetical protein
VSFESNVNFSSEYAWATPERIWGKVEPITAFAGNWVHSEIASARDSKGKSAAWASEVQRKPKQLEQECEDWKRKSWRSAREIWGVAESFAFAKLLGKDSHGDSYVPDVCHCSFIPYQEMI